MTPKLQKVLESPAAVHDIVPRHSFAFSTAATLGVALVPTFAVFGILVFGQPNPRPFLATILSILMTAGAIVLGSSLWNTQPESEGFSFGDLMLWSWVRREWAERQLVESTAVLGFDRHGTYVGNSDATPEEQMRAVYDIAAALDAKSSYTLGHSKRVEKHARKVAESLGLSQDETQALVTAAALHDIGNISIHDEILRKAGELTVEERSSIEAHVLLGAMMVLKAGSDDVVEGIRHHHERWDGSGYPSGLSGEDIPLYARIIGIAEAYDAMTSKRPYRQGFGRDHAIEVLRSESGLQFDADLVEMFVATLPASLSIVKKFPFLARFQRQAQELRLVFKRMGSVVLSATASTIAIALILGSTILSTGVPEDADGRSPRRRVAPIDKVLGQRVAAAPELIHATAASDGVFASEASARSAFTSASINSNVDGTTFDFPGPGTDPGIDPGTGGGGNGGGGNGGGGDGDDDGSDNGSGGPGGSAPGVDPGGISPPVTDPGNTDPGSTDPGTTPGNGNGNGNGYGKGGNPDKGPKPDKGNSGTAPGHSGGEAPGNSDTAPGNSGGNGNGNSGEAPGNSGGNGNGNSGEAPGNSEDQGKDKSAESPAPASTPGNNGNGNGGGKPKDDE